MFPILINSARKAKVRKIVNTFVTMGIRTVGECGGCATTECPVIYKKILNVNYLPMKVVSVVRNFKFA